MPARRVPCLANDHAARSRALFWRWTDWHSFLDLALDESLTYRSSQQASRWPRHGRCQREQRRFLEKDLDIRNRRRTPRCRDISPSHAESRPRTSAEVESRPRRLAQLHNASIAPHQRSSPRGFSHGLGRPARESPYAADRQVEPLRRRHSSLKMGGEAVCRYDVEPCARQQHDSRRLRLSVTIRQSFEDG